MKLINPCRTEVNELIFAQSCTKNKLSPTNLWQAGATHLTAFFCEMNMKFEGNQIETLKKVYRFFLKVDLPFPRRK